MDSDVAWLIRTILIIAVIVGFVAGVSVFVFNAIAENAGTRICVSTFDCRDLWMQECLATERYTREECIQLVTVRKAAP